MNDGNEGTPATAAAETTTATETTAEVSAEVSAQDNVQATADAANAAEQTPTTAQEAPAAAEDTGGAAEAPAAAPPWFKYGDQEFADQAALTAHLDKERETARRERLNFDDYSQRVATAAQERQAHREAQAKFQQEQQQWAASRAQYEALDAAVRSNPQLRQYVAQLLQQRGVQQPQQQQTADAAPPTGGISMDQLPPEVQQIIKENQEFKEEREWENMLTSVFSDKEALPHGTDEDGVRETLEAISKSPDKAREIALLAARYHHLKQANTSGTLSSDGPNGAAPRQLNGAGGAGAPIDSFEMKENETPEELRDRILLAKGLAV